MGLSCAGGVRVRRAIALAPAFWSAYQYRGIVYAMRGDHAASFRDYRKTRGNHRASLIDRFAVLKGTHDATYSRKDRFYRCRLCRPAGESSTRTPSGAGQVAAAGRAYRA